MITVYVWPDGTWTDEESELYMYLRWMSDDYQTLELTWEAYEQFVNSQ